MNTVLSMAGTSVSVVVSLQNDYYSKLPLSLAENLIHVIKIVILLLPVEAFI